MSAVPLSEVIETLSDYEKEFDRLGYEHRTDYVPILDRIEAHGIAEVESLKEELRVTDKNHGNTTVMAHKALKENDVLKQQNAELESINESLRNQNTELDEVLADYEAKEAVYAELLATLVEAREMVDDWAAYASGYFRNKHDLAGDLAKLDAAIAKAKGGDA